MTLLLLLLLQLPLLLVLFLLFLIKTAWRIPLTWFIFSRISGNNCNTSDGTIIPTGQTVHNSSTTACRCQGVNFFMNNDALCTHSIAVAANAHVGNFSGSSRNCTIITNDVNQCGRDGVFSLLSSALILMSGTVGNKATNNIYIMGSWYTHTHTPVSYTHLTLPTTRMV